MSNSSMAGVLALVTLSGGTASAHLDDATFDAPLIAASLSQASGLIQRGDAQNMDLFFASPYGFCDAKKVAHVWNTDIGSAKAIIGGKIAAGLTDLVDADIAGTGAAVVCSWEEVGLTYADAEILADMWGLATPWEAKVRVQAEATSLGHKRFWEEYGFMLHEAHDAHQADAEFLSYFARSDYGYCDAMKVAQVWNTNIVEAKMVIGRKVLSGLTDLIDADIASTANAVRCSWVETSLDFNDASALASFWGVPVGEAKQKATNYVSQWGTKGFRERLAHVLPSRA